MLKDLGVDEFKDDLGNSEIESIGQLSGTETLRPRARLLRTLGDELISSETVAIIELVKNAYDADATRVLVRFNEPLELRKGSIEVIDNGHGMSLETIRTTWMEPATLSKKRELLSEQKKRRVLGEKGIGRFATSRLADFLEVVTRRTNSEDEIRVLFDWSQFDDSKKYLDQIEILWEEVKPTEICPKGAIQSLWRENESPKSGELTHGTILRMEGLRTNWNKKQFEEDLRTNLARLVSPFNPTEDEFRIYLELPEPFDHLSGIVEPPETLEDPHYLIRGNVDENGQYELSLKLRGQSELKELKGVFPLESGRTPRCGPFFVELRVWDLDPESLKELIQTSGSTLKDVRRDLNSAAGINIYRDGFRVLPYGEPRNDWLRLDIRRFGNPTLRLSNNQIVGYVLISNDKNSLLRDQSNREGLIEGPALEDFRELIKAVLSELEAQRATIRPRKKKTAGQGLFSDFNLKTLANFVNKRYADDTELVSLLQDTEKDLTEHVEKVQEVISRYRRLATLGKLINTILHDGRTPLAKIRNNAQIGQDSVKDSGYSEDEFVQQLGQYFDVIEMHSETLATLFNRIEPFGGRKRGRPKSIELEKIIADIFELLNTELHKANVKVTLPGTVTLVTADEVEIREVIYNLLDNALYWLAQVPKDLREIIVQVNRIATDAVEILFSDSGPGVDDEFRENIFDPWFSRKPDGEGLGLAIAGEIVNDYYEGSLELIESDILPGATFRITLRKRV